MCTMHRRTRQRNTSPAVRGTSQIATTFSVSLFFLSHFFSFFFFFSFPFCSDASHGISRYFLSYSIFFCIFSFDAEHIISYATRKPNIMRIFRMHRHTHTYTHKGIRVGRNGCNFSFAAEPAEESNSKNWPKIKCKESNARKCLQRICRV